MNWRSSLGLIAAGIFIVGGTSAAFAEEGLPPGPEFSGTSIKTITATLRDGTGSAVGAVQLSQDAEGVVKLTVSGSGLTPGLHGIHVHGVGICEGPGFTTAGGHFNPAAKKHGLLSPDGHHNGDLENLEVLENGTMTYVTTSDSISLLTGATSLFDVDGTALVVHASADDHITDPTGNSGGRVACAVLAAPDPSLATPTPVATVPATPTRAVPLPPNTGSGASGGMSVEWSWLAASLALAGGIVAFGMRGQRKSE